MDEREKVEALLAIMREHDLDALTVRDGETCFELVRREPQRAAGPPPAAPQPASAPAAAASAAAAPSNDRAQRVTAPVVGVFYRSPSPGAEPFVSVGDRVTVGQPLCILEAMKLMNEITSDYAGVVTRILAENGELVTLGDELFWIEP